ncbi:PREDICTED: protein THEMIS2-like [Gekko japonicus]|uniref:Protein THEMIS2-like n=1 Tax=Gekko japonicus TaxID=146911 RepID=A0ABM1KK75_GEKJA|nr:PREDICTED: protein THEMIS2-like [Gekko japonicus]
MESMSLQQYICNLDFHSLPRVVKICSGVYFQGSVYEISGSECCLPTGELIKIVDVQLQKVNCESIEKDHLVELPLNFKGLFQLSPDQPHRTQMKRFLPGALSFKRKPSTCDKQQYTLQEILQSPPMQGKALTCSEIGNSKYQLCPVYKVKAIMHLRNDVVRIDSTLDVDVVDVTEESQHIHFIKPLMLSEVLLMDNVLPVRAEILGASEDAPIFHSKWVSQLQRGCKIQVHGKVSSWKILASSRKGRRRTCHFLISSSYEGRFRRCPREFQSTSELASGLGLAKKLHVVVTKDYDGSDTELPLFGIGDRLEVLSLMRAANPSAMDALECIRDSGDGDAERIKVPLFLDAGFVEEVRDSRKYSLPEVVEHFQLPCEVKVVANKDAPDPLSCVSVLTLEAQITEPFLTVSLEEEPSATFEVPPQWLDVSLFFTGGPAKPMPPSSSPKVEELTEAFYYSLLKMLPNNAPAPPRPPKRSNSEKNKQSQRTSREGGRKTSEPTKLPSTDSKDMFRETAKLLYPRTLQARADSETLVNPNQYSIQYGPPRPQKPTKTFKQAIDAHSSDNSDHDYEDICERFQETARKM